MESKYFKTKELLMDWMVNNYGLFKNPIGKYSSIDRLFYLYYDLNG